MKNKKDNIFITIDKKVPLLLDGSSIKKSTTHNPKSVRLYIRIK